MMPTLERMGRVGVWTSQFAALPQREVRDAVAHLETLGLPALWFGEAFGREAMALGSLLLESTKRMVVASGIANIYARDATAMVNGARSLAEASGDRFVLGIGVSHAPLVTGRGAAYLSPYGALDDYLTAMSEVRKAGPDPDDPVPVVVGALGPRMCALAARRVQGVHPYFTPVSHTKETRGIIGESFLAPEQMVILTDDRSEAMAVAKKVGAGYLRLPNYLRMLASQGFDGDEVEAFSDAFFDAIFAWGDAAACAARVAEHLDAGADHVCVQVLPTSPGPFPADEWSQLAPALAELQRS